MKLAEPPALPPEVPADSGWAASLALEFAHREGRTVPSLRAHRGPLRIQKGFTPEGADLWHQVIVHPPGGVASGDSLSISIEAGPHARALLTSPGAAKWYRANQHAPVKQARQSLNLRVQSGASLEWLPLESIVFDGAQAEWHSHFELAADASLVAAELVCLGRPAARECFNTGVLRWHTEIVRDRQLLFSERVVLEGGSPVLNSPAGLAGCSAFATLWLVSGQDNLASLMDCVRQALDDSREWWAVTTLPGLVILRWRGAGAEDGWRVLRTAWAAARPFMLGRPACAPRIWST